VREKEIGGGVWTKKLEQGTLLKPGGAFVYRRGKSVGGVPEGRWFNSERGVDRQGKKNPRLFVRGGEKAEKVALSQGGRVLCARGCGP